MQERERISLDPRVWGKSYWSVIHLSAISYPNISPSKNERIKFKNFYESFSETLPCEKCRINYLEDIEKIPIDNYLDNRDKLFEWTVKMRNATNIRIGMRKMSVEEVQNECEKIIDANNNYNKKNIDNNNSNKKNIDKKNYYKKYIIYISIIISILIISLVIYKRNSLIKIFKK